MKVQTVQRNFQKIKCRGGRLSDIGGGTLRYLPHFHPVEQQLCHIPVNEWHGKYAATRSLTRFSGFSKYLLEITFNIFGYDAKSVATLS